MEMWLWLTYLSGVASWVGWLFMIPVGSVIYGWMVFDAFFLQIFYPLIDGVDTYQMYARGPLRRAATGSFLFMMNVAWAAIPGVSIISSYALGYMAVLDYYDYNYDYETFVVTKPDWYEDACELLNKCVE